MALRCYTSLPYKIAGLPKVLCAESALHVRQAAYALRFSAVHKRQKGSNQPPNMRQRSSEAIGIRAFYWKLCIFFIDEVAKRPLRERDTHTYRSL